MQKAIINTCSSYFGSENRFISALPEILVVDTNQIGNNLDFQSLFQIDLSTVMQGNVLLPVLEQSIENGESKIYELYAMSLYCGTGESGHYIAVTYSPIIQRWFRCEAENVDILPINDRGGIDEITGWTPKLLFYRKQSSIWVVSRPNERDHRSQNRNEGKQQVFSNPLETPHQCRTIPPSVQSLSTQMPFSPFSVRVGLTLPDTKRIKLKQTKSIPPELPITNKPQQVELECPVNLCGFHAKSEANMDRHIKEMHPNEKPIRCTSPGCSFCTSAYRYLADHHRHRNKPLSKCPYCDFHCKDARTLSRHTAHHRSPGKFRCSKCNYSSDRWRELATHESEDHLNKDPMSTLMSCDDDTVGPQSLADNHCSSLPFPAIDKITPIQPFNGPPFIAPPLNPPTRRIDITQS